MRRAWKELCKEVGREAAGGNAIALIEIDGELPSDVLAKVRALPRVQQAKPLRF
jgi:D-3-phosphoglycerate dehydrogenase / 2-oxoglutarate reductase